MTNIIKTLAAWARRNNARAALLAVAAVLAAVAEAKQQTVYLFGVSTSFNDSVVYVTDVQELQGAYIEDTREKFLVGRDDYSYQLRNHCLAQGLPNRTCTTFWATSRKDIERQYVKVMERLMPQSAKKRKKRKKQRSEVRVVVIPANVFAYTVAKPDEGTLYVNPEEAERAAQQSKKHAPKDAKPAPDGTMPPPPNGQAPAPNGPKQ